MKMHTEFTKFGNIPAGAWKRGDGSFVVEFGSNYNQFQTRVEAESFIDSFALNCVSNTISQNGEKFGIIMDGDRITFVVDEKEIPWIGDSQAKQEIVKYFQTTNNKLTFDLPQVGASVVGRVLQSIFGNRYAPNPDLEQIKSIKTYVLDNALFSQIMNLQIGNIEDYGGEGFDKNDVGHVHYMFDSKFGIKNMVSHILNLDDIMKPLDFDLTVVRRTSLDRLKNNLGSQTQSMKIDDFTSTTISEQSIQDSGFSHGDTDVYIKIPKGTPLAWLGLLHKTDANTVSMLQENEVLLPPMKYIVSDIQNLQNENNRNVIRMDAAEQLNVNEIVLRSLEKMKSESHGTSELILSKIDEIIQSVMQRQKSNLIETPTTNTFKDLEVNK